MPTYYGTLPCPNCYCDIEDLPYVEGHVATCATCGAQSKFVGDEQPYLALLPVPPATEPGLTAVYFESCPLGWDTGWYYQRPGGRPIGPFKSEAAANDADEDSAYPTTNTAWQAPDA